MHVELIVTKKGDFAGKSGDISTAYEIMKNLAPTW
jgi:hypothetical protein